MARVNATVQVVLDVAFKVFAAMRNTAIACSLVGGLSAVGFAQTVPSTTTIHGIGGNRAANICQRLPVMRPEPQCR